MGPSPSERAKPKLFVTPDVMVLRHANCVFTMQIFLSNKLDTLQIKHHFNQGVLNVCVDLGACSPTTEDTAVSTEEAEVVAEAGDDFIPDDVDTSICEEDYALCGTVKMPSDFTGVPRNLAVVLPIHSSRRSSSIYP